LARSVDLRLLRATAHSPSYFALTRDSSGGQTDLVDFCIPCNPYFPTPGMFDRLRDNLEGILKYYPSDADTITRELCATLGLNPQTVAMGNGSTELITWIDHLFVRDSLAIPIPTFGRWTDQPLETGKRVDMFPLYESQGFRLDVDSYVRFVRERGSRVAVICNPNNPDGGYVARQDIVRLMDLLNYLDLVVIDESFIDFVDAEPYRSVAEEAAIRPNVIVLKSLGKNFGLHGVRFGYMVSNPALAGRIKRALPKWNLNAFAEVVVFLLKEHQEEYHHSLRLLARDRKLMFDQLSQLPGLTVLPSQGNFLLIKLPEGRDGVELRDYLISEFGVYVRECGNKLGSSSQFLRLVVRPQPDVQRLLNGLFAFLYGVETLAPQQQPQHHRPQLAPAAAQRSADPDAQWAAAVADIAASRPVTVADILAARPVAAVETAAQHQMAVASTTHTANGMNAANGMNPGNGMNAASGMNAGNGMNSAHGVNAANGVGAVNAADVSRPVARRPVAITDTDAQWQATVADIAAARQSTVDSGQWPAVSDNPPRPAVDETGAHWSAVADLASARPSATVGTAGEKRSSRPTVADIGGARPTVADVNARSGYGQLGIDDRFALAPNHTRDQGPGTDWITIQRRGNT
jgi:histidinol-phosphate/aromatic aminotransferase/cobyric acid decarboxylase-like protein